MNTTSQSTHWRAAGIALLLIFGAILASYTQTVSYLGQLWGNISEGEYAHGYLVLAISAYLIYCNRHRLGRLTPCPQYRVLPLLLGAVCFWLLAALTDVVTAQAAALLGVILMVVWTLLGTRVISVLFFPIAFISFAIPVWFPLSPLLQNITADAVFAMIRLLGVPAMRQENLIVLSSGTLSIEEACSGLRYLMAALTLGALYAYLNYQGLMARAAVVLVAALAAVLSNFLRVFIVVYLGYRTDMKHELVHDHLMLGWYLFGGVMVLLLVLDSFLARYMPADTGGDDAPGRAASPDCNRGAGHFLLAGIAVGVIVLAGPALLKAQALAGMAAEAGPVQLVPAQRIGNWRASGDEGLNWSPVFHGATTVSQAYRQDNQQVTCFIGYYPRQRQGEELINDLNSIANHDVWIGQYAHERKLTVAGIDRREQLLKTASGGKMLVWYYYNVAGYKTSSRYLAKLYQVAGLLSGDASAYVVIAATPVVTGLPAARSVLADFSESVQQQEEKAGKLFQVVTDGAGQLVHQAFSGNQGRRYMALQGKEK